MLIHFSALLCGFSIFSSLILVIAYLFFLPGMRKTWPSKFFCVLLLVNFGALQSAHYLHFLYDYDPISQIYYLYLLLLAPSLFYGLSRTVLFPESQWTLLDACHLLPLLAGILLPTKILAAYSFVVGTGYTLWMFIKVYELRGQSSRFHFELFFFALFALMAVTALVLGLSIPYIDRMLFYLAYSNSIGLAILLVVAALILFPHITQDIVDALDSAYARSKLQGIDTEEKVKRLAHLMDEEKVYQEESLDLTSLAERLDLSSHQLSELINTRFSIGFPRYIRERRVAEAMRLLVNEPEASVLAISMMIGFKSQSSFYTAFHEIVGKSPGNFRKEKLADGS